MSKNAQQNQLRLVNWASDAINSGITGQFNIIHEVLQVIDKITVRLGSAEQRPKADGINPAEMIKSLRNAGFESNSFSIMLTGNEKDGNGKVIIVCREKSGREMIAQRNYQLES